MDDLSISRSNIEKLKKLHQVYSIEELVASMKVCNRERKNQMELQEEAYTTENIVIAILEKELKREE